MAKAKKPTDKNAAANKKTKKPAKPKAAKPPKPDAKKFNSEVNEEDRALFHIHLPKIEDLRAKLNTANSNLRNAYKTAKAEGGFSKADFDTAIQMKTPENEAKEKGKIARTLVIAKYMGSDLGHQLDMFLEPSRVPAADHAYEEGKMDSMQGKTAKPSYDPSTEQYRMYMQGFHDDTARRVKEGIKKPTEPKVGDKKVITKAEKEAAAKPAPEAPKSGVAMTRSEFMAQQAAKKAEAAPDPRVAAESVFKKKGAAAASN